MYPAASDHDKMHYIVGVVTSTPCELKALYTVSNRHFEIQPHILGSYCQLGPIIVYDIVGLIDVLP